MSRWLLAAIVAFLVGALLGLWAMRETPEDKDYWLSLWRDFQDIESV